VGYAVACEPRQIVLFAPMSIWCCISLALGVCATACANPRVIFPQTRVYLSSERVSVTISPTEAQVSATFTFRFDPDRLDYVKDLGLSIQVPIWLPDVAAANSAVERFWQSFGGTLLHAMTEDARPRFDEVFSFSAILGTQRLSVERFMTYSSHLDPRILPYNRWAEKKVEFQKFKRDGVACTIVEVSCQGTMLRGETPLVVSYRQPLVRNAQTGRFLYLPAFYDLPEGAPTTDTNRYSITLTAAKGCSVQVINGRHRHALASGQSIILTPIHHQPISAMAQAGSKQAIQGTGSSLFAQETNRTAPAGGLRH